MKSLRYLFIALILCAAVSCSNNCYDQDKVYEYYTRPTLTTEDYSDIVNQLEANIQLQIKSISKLAKKEDLISRRAQLQEYFRSSEGQNLLEAQRWMEWVLQRNYSSLTEETAEKYSEIKDGIMIEYVDLINSFY